MNVDETTGSNETRSDNAQDRLVGSPRSHESNVSTPRVLKT